MKFLFSLLTLTLALNVQAKSIKVMQYNAENFFDTTHDPHTDDWTYLPLATKNSTPGFNEMCAKLDTPFYVKECLSLDWNEAKMTKKIVNIAKVIKSFDASGKGPDIIVLEEIENKNVLNKLVTKGLPGLGYQNTVLIEGDDTRGIDVAVISKYPVVSAKRYPIILNGQKLDTRGILEVMIKVENQDVVVYANHWPSQSNPAAQRVASAQALMQLASLQKTADLVIALGDFNTIKTDQPAPFSYLTAFTDAEPEARKVVSGLNGGTHFFKGQWVSLDHIFILKTSAMKPMYNTFQIMNRPFMLTSQGAPNRFNFETGEGFSDHLPIGMEFSY